MHGGVWNEPGTSVEFVDCTFNLLNGIVNYGFKYFIGCLSSGNWLNFLREMESLGFNTDRSLSCLQPCPLGAPRSGVLLGTKIPLGIFGEG